MFFKKNLMLSQIEQALRVYLSEHPDAFTKKQSMTESTLHFMLHYGYLAYHIKTDINVYSTSKDTIPCINYTNKYLHVLDLIKSAVSRKLENTECDEIEHTLFQFHLFYIRNTNPYIGDTYMNLGGFLHPKLIKRDYITILPCWYGDLSEVKTKYPDYNMDCFYEQTQCEFNNTFPWFRFNDHKLIGKHSYPTLDYYNSFNTRNSSFDNSDTFYNWSKPQDCINMEYFIATLQRSNGEENHQPLLSHEEANCIAKIPRDIKLRLEMEQFQIIDQKDTIHSPIIEQLNILIRKNTKTSCKTIKLITQYHLLNAEHEASVTKPLELTEMEILYQDALKHRNRYIRVNDMLHRYSLVLDTVMQLFKDQIVIGKGNYFQFNGSL